MSSDSNATAARRLTKITDFLTNNKTAFEPPWDPNCTIFPNRKNLPKIKDAPDGAAWMWGENDQLGRINLLTPSRVAAARSEIKTGDTIPVNLPLNIPEIPSFGRAKFKHEIKALRPDLAYDDLYELNTQSGTQWDGFRHVAHAATKTFYNGGKGSDWSGPNPNLKNSIHNISEHGIAGRGVLLDFRGYAERKGIRYDPYDHYKVTYDQLYACGKDQGIDIRPAKDGGDIRIGDMLFVRCGWKQAHDNFTPEERERIQSREHKPGKDSPVRFAGLAQEEQVLDWLHDCYFATVAGDAPAFEAWPSQEDFMLHEYLLAMWGVMIGEMLDLETLASKCREQNRWFFFFTSAPANVKGGVASHVNGTAIL